MRQRGRETLGDHHPRSGHWSKINDLKSEGNGVANPSGQGIDELDQGDVNRWLGRDQHAAEDHDL